MSTDTEQAKSEAFENACVELAERVLSGEIERDEVESAKFEVCSTYSSPKVPTNSDILAKAPKDRREEAEAVLRRKPVRTASGVSPVAIMT